MTRSDRSARIEPEVVDALESLGNRQRLQILLALAERERERQRQWNSMSFTELYEAIDVDSSSQFAYHLDRLVGQFVAETPDGYRLTYGGHKIVRAIRSGVYESAPAFAERSVSGVCIFCEASSLVATLENEQFLVRCDACDSTLLTDVFPRSQTRHRSANEILESSGHRIWGTYVQLRGDVCPECYGRVDTAVDAHERGGKTLYALESTCRECWFTIHVPIEVAVAFHPAVAGLFWEQGVSLLDVPLWEFFEFVVSGTIATAVVSREPLECEFTITLDGKRHRFEMDETLRITPAHPGSD